MHPMMVMLPVGFFFSALLMDIAYAATRSSTFAVPALWLVAAGVVSALVAAVLGLIDFITIKRARKTWWGWFHLTANLIAVILSTVSWILRHAGDPEDAILPGGLTISVIVAVGIIASGWAGGELSYRHKIGVVDVGQDRQHVDKAREMPQSG